MFLSQEIPIPENLQETSLHSSLPDRNTSLETSVDLPSPVPSLSPQNELTQFDFSPIYSQKVTSYVKKTLFSFSDKCKYITNDETPRCQSATQNNLKSILKQKFTVTKKSAHYVEDEIEFRRQCSGASDTESFLQEVRKSSESDEIKVELKPPEYYTLRSVGLVRAVSEKFAFLSKEKSSQEVSKNYQRSSSKKDNPPYSPVKCDAKPWPLPPFTVNLNKL